MLKVLVYIGDSQKIMMTLLSEVTQDYSILVVQTVIKTYTDPK